MTMMTTSMMTKAMMTCSTAKAQQPHSTHAGGLRERVHGRRSDPHRIVPAV
jgi:hypothetical protein